MNAIIKTGGKQYRVSAGDKLNVETLAGEPGDELKFDEVLMISDGDDVKIGTPTVGLTASQIFALFIAYSSPKPRR